MPVTEPSTRRRPTQRDVARVAGVSTATVSYVLSGRRGGRPPSPATTERVVAAAAELGYERDHIARSLRRQRSDVLAVVYPAPSSPWSDRLVEQLQARAADHEQTVIALPVAATTPDRAVWRALREGYVDGGIVLPDSPLGGEDLHRLAQRGLALVVVDDLLEPDKFDVVRQNRLAACRAAMERLVDAGHRRIAYLAHAHEHPGKPGSVKRRSYLEVMRERGLEVDPQLVVPVADSRSEAYRAVQELLALTDPPTAVFSATDRAAVDGIWAARDAGVPVPDGLAVVGIGNIPEGLMISPQLTTVGAADLDFMPLVDRLLARVDAETVLPGAELSDPWELIVRGSG